MMKCEFEKIAGYRVSDEDYIEIIEPMYMATTLDKNEFVKCVDRERFDIQIKEEKMIRKIRWLAEVIKAKCHSDACINERAEMYKMIETLKDNFGYECELKEENKLGITCPVELVVITPEGTNIKWIL